jgi:hypothetical protein
MLTTFVSARPVVRYDIRVAGCASMLTAMPSRLGGLDRGDTESVCDGRITLLTVAV